MVTISFLRIDNFVSRVEGFLPREVVVGGGGGGSRGGVRGRGRTALPELTVGVLEVSIQSEKEIRKIYF